MKIVFMGTPDFAAGALKSIAEAGHDILLCVTQPDRPKGRSGKPVFSPVKQYAIGAGIPVFQPVKIKDRTAVEELSKYEADIFVVAAFGQILSKEILDMPRLGCVNIHASLLPKYRGAAPIQWAILDGEARTGVTIMKMDAGLDTGDMLTRAVVDIDRHETADTLHDRLMEAGAKLIVDTLPLIEAGSITPEKQDDSLSTYASMMSRDMGRIEWKEPAMVIERKVRAFNSWPGTHTLLRGKSLKIWEAEADDTAGSTALPGTIVALTKEVITVACGTGVLNIKSLQAEGKKRMDTKSFLLGFRPEEGERMGE